MEPASSVRKWHSSDAIAEGLGASVSLGKGPGPPTRGWRGCSWRFCVPLQATWFGHCHRWGQARPVKAFWFWTSHWGVRTPIPNGCRLYPGCGSSRGGERLAWEWRALLPSGHRLPNARWGMRLVSVMVPYFISIELSTWTCNSLSTSPNSSLAWEFIE